jgi:hypothetical protein
MLADPAFDPERTVVVREISHSEFMDLAEGRERRPADDDER